MTIYRLFDEPVFPDPEYADPDGLLAVGGDLSPMRLLNAYSNGIFPWYAEGSPILWWSTNPRLVLIPDEFHIPRSLRRVLNKGTFSFTMDTDFSAVINQCACCPRPEQDGTWIVDEMVEAYTALHELGYAHSVEAWQDGELVGGLYGVSLGSIFFGESMFYRVPDASKAAFAVFVEQVRKWGFSSSIASRQRTISFGSAHGNCNGSGSWPWFGKVWNSQPEKGAGVSTISPNRLP